MEDYFWRVVHWAIGWNRIPRKLQQRIDSVLENLPASMDGHALVIPRLVVWRFYLLSGMFCALFGWALSQRSGTNATAWIIGGTAFGIASSAALFRSSPLMLVLAPSGVTFVYRKCDVLCPWSLFTARGEPFHHGMTLLLPVNPDAITDVQLRCGGTVVRWTADERLVGFSFVGKTQFQLLNNFQLASPILGMLIQEMAFALCEDPIAVEDGDCDNLADDEPRDFDTAAQPLAVNTDVEPNGRYVVLPVTRLQFPLECCNCGRPTEEQVRIEAPERRWFLQSTSSLFFNIPCCTRCRRFESLRAWAGGLLTLSTLLACATFVAFTFLGPPQQDWSKFLIIVGAFTVLPAFVVADLGFRSLLKTKATYSQASECVRIAFRQPGHAHRIVQFHGGRVV